jgi:hypothetical protein
VSGGLKETPSRRPRRISDNHRDASGNHSVRRAAELVMMCLHCGQDCGGWCEPGDHRYEEDD